MSPCILWDEEGVWLLATKRTATELEKHIESFASGFGWAEPDAWEECTAVLFSRAGLDECTRFNNLIHSKMCLFPFFPFPVPETFDNSFPTYTIDCKKVLTIVVGAYIPVQCSKNIAFNLLYCGNRLSSNVRRNVKQISVSIIVPKFIKK